MVGAARGGLRVIPRNALPIVMIDANARFREYSEPTFVAGRQAVNQNAEHLQSFIGQHGLEGSSSHDVKGHRVVTWVSPNGVPAHLDYVLFPRELVCSALTQGKPENFQDPTEIDHEVMSMSLSWQAEVKSGKSIPRWDTKAMRSSEGQDTLCKIFASVPAVGWEQHPDVHLQVVNEHVFTELGKHFQSPRDAPRELHVSEQQWTSVRCRRQARRLMRRIKLRARKSILDFFFLAWRSHVGGGDGARVWQRCSLGVQLRRLGFLEAQLTKVIQGLNRTIRTQGAKDAAAFVRETVASARQQGTEALAKALRGVMKCGRRYRAPVAAPALCVDGVFITEPEEVNCALERHFAGPERAVERSLQDLLLADEPAQVDVFDARCVPGLLEIAEGFKAMKDGKAPGLSSIPVEAYKYAALPAAEVHLPIVLKSVQRGLMPLLWRGARAAAIPKPAKNLSAPQGWRSVALHEVACKGLGRAIRQRLTDGLRLVSQRGQHGSLKQQHISIPSQYVRTYLQMLNSTGQSGGVLFVDGRDAF